MNNKKVNLYYFDDDCPLAVGGKINQEFKDSVIKILQRDFSLLFNGMEFEYNFIDEVIPLKYEKLSGWYWKNKTKKTAKISDFGGVAG